MISRDINTYKPAIYNTILLTWVSNTVHCDSVVHSEASGQRISTLLHPIGSFIKWKVPCIVLLYCTKLSEHQGQTYSPWTWTKCNTGVEDFLSPTLNRPQTSWKNENHDASMTYTNFSCMNRLSIVAWEVCVVIWGLGITDFLTTVPWNMLPVTQDFSNVHEVHCR